MAAVIPFNDALRERLEQLPADDAGARFMSALMSGEGSRDDYIALVAQYSFIYGALEHAVAGLRDDPVLSGFVRPAPARIPAIEADLAFLIGPDWRDRITPLVTTERYVARITDVAERWPAGLVAHHYTRYLGDLSGSQIVRTLVQRRFGFETNGVGFFLFAGIASPREFKERYRSQLENAGWSPAERDRVIDEVVAAHRYNAAMFDELERARWRAGA